MKQWDSLHHSKNKSEKFHPRAPMAALGSLAPGLTWSSWRKQGITHIADAYHNQQLMPFPDLQKKYGLPNSSIFQYLQLKSIAAHKILTQRDTTPHDHHFLDAIHDRCWQTPTKPKSLALCYASLLHNTATTHFPYEKQ
ncbi:Hypothetical predicted protein, partial [Pelobates cultripes]